MKGDSTVCFKLSLPNEGKEGHRLGVNKIRISQKNNLLYSASRDGSIICWDISV